jgi:hypothetical protein
VRYRACEAEVGRDCEGRRTEGRGRRQARFLPTVTIGDEKCVIEREGRKLDATVRVGDEKCDTEHKTLAQELLNQQCNRSIGPAGHFGGCIIGDLIRGYSRR